MESKVYDLKKHPFMLEIGTPLQLDIEGFRSRFKSSLIGVVPNEHLIVQAPQLSMFVGEQKHWPPEADITVRCLHRGNIWGFKSRLTRVISTPAQLMMIEYPESIENHNLRTHQRIDCYLPGQVQSGKTTRNGVVLDISEEGCCFSIKNGKRPLDLEVDAELVLKCQLPGIDGDQEFSGLVKRVEKDEFRTLIGVLFGAIDPKVRKHIAKYASAIAEAAQ
jgi:c-di-GMP-binding flagellar brake protein YcgR